MRSHLRIYILLWLSLLISSSVSAKILTDLEELVDSDSFFSFIPVDLKQRKIPSRSLDYSIQQGFDPGLSRDFELLESSQNMQRFSEEFLYPRIPLKLWEYVVAKGFEVELHFGKLEESLHLLDRQGYNFLYQVTPEDRIGSEVLIVPGSQGDVPGPGLFVITEIEDPYLFKRFQFALKGVMEKLDEKRTPALRRVDFHLIGRESYKSARFKEVFHSLPIGLERVVGGEGRGVFIGLLARKFASMSLNLLKGLFGSEFLNPLKRSLIEEGYLGIQDWDVLPFEPLQKNDQAILDSNAYDLFNQFQKALVLVLSQSPLKPLSKILLSGNVLAIDKDGTRRKDLQKRFMLKSSLGSDDPIFAGILPVKSAGATSPILFTGEVYGDSLEQLYEVLSLVGISDIFHVGSVYSTSRALKPGDLVVPSSVKAGTLLKLEMPPVPVERISHLPLKFGLSGLYSLTPSHVSRNQKNIDFQDDHFLPAVRYLSRFQGTWGVLGVCKEEYSLKPIEIWRRNQTHQQNLIEALRLLYGIEDIDLNFSQSRKEFSSLEEKVSYYNHQFNLNEEDSILFHYALEDYFSRWLDGAQETNEYLKSSGFQVPSARKEDPFTYFLQRPFKDQDVFSHIFQVEKALTELRVYLKLLGEESASVQVHGEFLNGTFTPLSPFIFSLDEISQKSFAELLNTPFSGRSTTRKFLLRMVSSGERPLSDVGFELSSLQEGDLSKIYLEILMGIGIGAREEEGKRKLYRNDSLHTDSLHEEVRRWYIGSETYLALARRDFIREKSQVFSLAPWSQERVGRLSQALNEGIVRLAGEGLEIKEAIQSSSLSEEDKEELTELINEEISHLERFVRVFEGY